MGKPIHLPTQDGASIGAYRVEAAGEPRGGLVVIQEIFGVNAHIRSIAERFAALGYTTVAPAFFDHLESGVELDYSEASLIRGRKLAMELSFDRVVQDVASAARSLHGVGKIGTVGYCWGGTVAFLSAIELGLPSVSYYGARNVAFLGQMPKAPVIFHFGAQDPSIPPEMVDKHRQMLPQMGIYLYPDAGHAFNRDIDPHHYHQASAELALERTLAFFDKYVAGA